MPGSQQWSELLTDVAAPELRAFLTEHSGLPGPRGNLELADAFAASAAAETIQAFADEPDEYLRFCGTQGLGRLILDVPADESLVALVLERAGDDSWRVREAAARALQIVGDVDLPRLRGIVTEWVGHPNPYVRRAAIAAICEPRLLGDDVTRAAALAACEVATASITALPPATRKDPAVRNLRQALGYCWSVAIAAFPEEGLASYAALERSDDPDVGWIVTSNQKKARL
jgi:hypothetical protein